MKQIIWVLIMLTIINVATAISIEKSLVYPSENLQGSSVDLCVIASDNNPQGWVEITFPNGIIRRYELEQQDEPFCIIGGNGTELSYRFTDTQQTGVYSAKLIARKGGETSSTTRNFGISPVSYLVDYVGNVGSVDTCKSVEEIREPELELFGTEYRPEQAGKVWLQLLDENNTEIEDAVCYTHIYKPNNEEYLHEAIMNYLDKGIYYYDFLTPSSQGVYPVLAECYFIATRTFEYVDAYAYDIGKDPEQNYLKTYTLDGDEQKLKEADYDGRKRISFNYNFTNMCGLNVSEDLLTGISLSTNFKWVSVTNDHLTIYIKNWTSGDWIELGNKIESPNDRTTVSNSISTSNLTRDGLVNSNGVLTIKFNDTTLTDGGETKVEMDWIRLSCEQLANPEWQEIRGASEIHISPPLVESSLSGEFWRIDTNTITADIKNITYSDGFYVNFTLSSLTSLIKEDVTVVFDMPLPFPCQHILNVSIDGIETDWFPQNPAISPITKGCSVSWIMDLDEEENYQIQITSENWFKVVEDTWATQMYLLNDYLQLACKNYQNATELPQYELNTTSSSFQQHDNYYDTCQQYIRLFYYWNNTFIDQLTPEAYGLTYADMQGLDENWRHLITIKEETQKIAQTIANGMVLGASYSGAVMQNPTGQPIPPYAIYWANASQSFNNYLELIYIPTKTWNYSIRNLTYYPTTNNTAVAQEIWDYNNRTLTNATNIAGDIWNWQNIGTRLLEWLDEVTGAIMTHITI